MFESISHILTKGRGINPFGRQYTLQEDFTFQHGGVEITIPAGYVWDGPSGFPIIGDSPWLSPSMIHDYLYANREVYDFTRAQVDELFYSQVRELGGSTILADLADNFFDPVFESMWMELDNVWITPNILFAFIITTFAITITLTTFYMISKTIKNK